MIAAECFACDGLGVGIFVGVGLEAVEWAEPGTGQEVVEEAAKSEWRAEVVPERTVEEKSVLVVVVVVEAAADKPASEATAGSAGAGEPAETAGGITALGL